MTPQSQTPPIFARAIAHLAGVARDRGVAFDVETTTFASLAPLMSHVPRAPFVLSLAALWAERTIKEHGAFWFPQREAPLGAALGLPDALVALAPVELAQAALDRNQLAELDDRSRELRESLSRARNDGATAAAVRGERLGVEDYRALFDPAFVQFLAVDEARAAEALALRIGDARALLAEAIASAVSDPVKREALEGLWLRALARFDENASLAEQARREPRAIEAFVRLFAARAGTGAADESFWADVVLAGSNNAGSNNADDNAPDDEARLLGVFRTNGARPLVPTLGGRARLYVVDARDLPVDLSARDAARSPPVTDDLREIAARRLEELAHVRNKGALAFRRLTEAELPHEALAPTVSEALRRHSGL